MDKTSNPPSAGGPPSSLFDQSIADHFAPAHEEEEEETGTSSYRLWLWTAVRAGYGDACAH